MDELDEKDASEASEVRDLAEVRPCALAEVREDVPRGASDASDASEVRDLAEVRPCALAEVREDVPRGASDASDASEVRDLAEEEVEADPSKLIKDLDAQVAEAAPASEVSDAANVITQLHYKKMPHDKEVVIYRKNLAVREMLRAPADRFINILDHLFVEQEREIDEEYARVKAQLITSASQLTAAEVKRFRHKLAEWHTGEQENISVDLGEVVAKMDSEGVDIRDAVNVIRGRRFGHFFRIDQNTQMCYRTAAYLSDAKHESGGG